MMGISRKKGHTYFLVTCANDADVAFGYLYFDGQTLGSTNGQHHNMHGQQKQNKNRRYVKGPAIK